MKVLPCIVAATALAGSVAGCAGPYSSYPQYGYSQGYNYPSTYSYYRPASYAYAPAYSYGPSYAYSYPRSYYGTDWNAYRNYQGIHAGPEISMSFP